MARAKGILAQLRAAEANYRAAKFVIVELAAALEGIAPNHQALEAYRVFIHGAKQPDETTDAS